VRNSDNLLAQVLVGCLVCSGLVWLAIGHRPDTVNTPTPPGRPTVEVVAPVPDEYARAVDDFEVAMMAAKADSVPPLISIALWLAQSYDVNVVHTEPLAFSAMAPTVGTTPVLYKWLFEVQVSEPPFPPEFVEGIGYRVDCLLYVDRADSVRAAVTAVDANGNHGPRSAWSRVYPVGP